MVLSQQEQRRFFQHYLPLLFYAGMWEGILPASAKLTGFAETSLNVKVACRNALFGDTDLIPSYLEDNAELLTEADQVFAFCVQDGIYGTFVVVKQYARFAVVQHLATQQFFHVVNLTESFAQLLPKLPAVVDTAIFTFGIRIVCDGLLEERGRLKLAEQKRLLETYRSDRAAGRVKALLL